MNSGAWISRGVMTFSNKEKATYSFHNGHILFSAVDDQGLWKGTWVEDQWGTIHCGDQIDGSSTWGEAIFQFDETYNEYKGTWDPCGSGRKNAWTGRCI